MLKTIAISAAMAVALAGPAYAQEKTAADKAKEFCTDAHMKEMDTKVSAITDADKKKSVTMHLDMSKAAFKKGDNDGCVKHMEAAHKAM